MSKSGKNRLILTGLGILLIVLALRGVVLRVAGESTQAIVTAVKKSTSQQDDPMDHNYQIAYRFAVNSKDYSGSLKQKKVYNTATLPRVGGTVPIRYLASAPTINGGANESVLSGLILGALGIGLLIAGIKPRKAAAQATPATDTPHSPTS